MRIGFDWYNTITAHPVLFAVMSNLLHELGARIYVISAVGGKQEHDIYLKKVKDNLSEINFTYDDIVIVGFESPHDVPELKLQAAKRLEITHFFDDRTDVCGWLGTNGIKTYHVK